MYTHICRSALLWNRGRLSLPKAFQEVQQTTWVGMRILFKWKMSIEHALPMVFNEIMSINTYACANTHTNTHTHAHRWWSTQAIKRPHRLGLHSSGPPLACVDVVSHSFMCTEPLLRHECHLFHVFRVRRAHITLSWAVAVSACTCRAQSKAVLV